MQTITVELPSNYTINQDPENPFVSRMFAGATVEAVSGNAVTISSPEEGVAEEVAEQVLGDVCTYEPRYVGIMNPGYYDEVRSWFGEDLSDQQAESVALAAAARVNSRLVVNLAPKDSGEKITVYEV